MLHKTSQPVSVRMLRGAAKVVLSIKSPIFLMCLLGSLAQQRSLGKAVILRQLTCFLSDFSIPLRSPIQILTSLTFTR